MRALPVQPEPLWRIDFRQRIAASLWFAPAIFAAAAIGAANLTIWLDAQVDAPIGVRPGLVSDPGTAAAFAAAFAAATLAFVAVMFATTLVAIQLAASQYSPGRCGSSSARGSPASRSACSWLPSSSP
jgi:uncharacterized membrane protein